MTTARDDASVHSLRRFIYFDVSSCATGAAVIGAVFVTVTQAVSLAAIGLVVVGAGAVMASGLRPLRHGDTAAAVARVAIANWVVAVLAAVVATFTWPMQVGAALIPPVLAAPHVSSHRVRAYAGVSLIVSVLIVAAGLLQDVTGLSAEIPETLRHLVLIGFTPFIGGMVALLARRNNDLMRAALNDAVASNERLLRSERSLRDQADQLRESRARIVAATDNERRRIERDIHDGVQQYLVGIDIQLATTQELLGRDDGEISMALERTREMVSGAHAELRCLAQGIFPPLLTKRGLPAALDDVADRAPIPVVTSIDDVGRQAPEIEAAIYFCCLEAVQNSAKHAGAGATVHLVLAERDGRLHFEVTDDGSGVPTPVPTSGNGVANMHDRIGAVGGRIGIEPAVPRGTRVAGWVGLAVPADSQRSLLASPRRSPARRPEPAAP